MMLSHFDSWSEVVAHLHQRNASEAVVKAAAVVWDDFVMSPAFPIQRLELDFEPPTLTTRELALMTGYSEVWLRQMRKQGQGPAFKKIDGRVIYDRAAVERWRDARLGDAA